MVVVRTLAVLALTLGLTACRADPELVADLEYVEVVTVADDESVLPLLIAIHGLGDRPESFCAFMQSGVRVPARIVCPRAPNEYGGGYSWFPPMRSLTSDAGLARAVEEAGDRVALLTQVLSRDPRMHGDPVVTGYSQGGMTSYYLALAHSDLYRAVVPIAGMLPASLREREPAGGEVALFGFHGKSDELVPYGEAKRTAAAFAQRWTDAALAEYDGVGHRMSTEMRRDVFERLNGLLGSVP